MQQVNSGNWTHTRFKQGPFLAFISFGAGPEEIEKDQLEYFVTVLENEDIEIFQQSFSELGQACLYLNQNYSDWEFDDQLVKKSGCSTCVAH